MWQLMFLCKENVVYYTMRLDSRKFRRFVSAQKTFCRRENFEITRGMNFFTVKRAHVKQIKS